jgi:tetratricopeptide (TPR) repeat protein
VSTTTRVLVAAAFAVGLASTRARPGRADDKKPGLFDFETWKTPAGRQRAAAKTLAPAELDVQPLGRFDEPPRALRLRVYADRDYRGGVLHWREKVRAEIEHVNHVVEPVFNVHFDLESLREWDASHVGVALDPILVELETMDAARDVDWVLGLVTPFTGVARSIHQIGLAPLSGRAFVMRAMDDEEEGRALEQELALLAPGERDELYGSRKAHKETVIFLHEWAHTMGALHVDEPTMVMSPRYDPQQAAFTDFEKRLVGLVLDARLGDRRQPFPESAALLRLLDKAPRDEGTQKEREALVEALGRRLGASPQGASPAPTGAPGTPAPTGAPGTPSATVEAAPRATTTAGSSATATAARATIDRAVALVRAGDLAGATPLVFEAARQSSAGPADANVLVRIASAAGAVGALTTADVALARLAPGARPGRLVAELEATRSRVALPREAAKLGIAPEDEPRYVAAFWTASHAVASRNLAAAERRLAELAEAFPDSPGRQVVACELALAAKRFAAAETFCAAALDEDPAAVPALLASARLAAHARRNDEAERRLRRAMLLDPTDDAAWSALARLYLDMGSTTQHAQLAREHQAIFATPLRDEEPSRQRP